jgi:hypothetical protein
MARYEEARGRYKKAVLASLGASNGDAIRKAIQDFQVASAELKRLRAPAAAAGPAVSRPEAKPANEPAWGFVWRLLRVG